MTRLDGERIADAARVSSLLKQLHEQRAILAVTLPDSADKFNSAILAIDEPAKRMMLDELTPRIGHERLLTNGKLHVFALLHGIGISFAATVRQVGRECGICYYRIRIPEQLNYLQQRANFRIRVGMTSGITVVLRCDQQQQFRGRVIDISESGLGITVRRALPLECGERLPCTLTLADGHEIECELEVRYVNHVSRPHEDTHFGGRFLDLAPRLHKRLARAIINLQRELMRKRPKNAR